MTPERKAAEEIAGDAPLFAELRRNYSPAFAFERTVNRTAEVIACHLAPERERAKRIEKLLRKYGKHGEFCVKKLPNIRCSCGWEQARAALEGLKNG